MSRRNFSQPSLADAFVKAYSRVGGFLEDIAKTFEWAAFDVLMGPLHSSSDGAPAYPPLTMFKIVLLQQWYGLSDPGAEEAVRDRLSFRRFCGVPLDQETPDHSSIWRFRQRIEKLGLSEKLLAEVNRQLDARGLIVKRHDHRGGGEAAVFRGRRGQRARSRRELHGEERRDLLWLQGASGGGRGERPCAPSGDDERRSARQSAGRSHDPGRRGGLLCRQGLRQPGAARQARRTRDRGQDRLQGQAQQAVDQLAGMVQQDGVAHSRRRRARERDDEELVWDGEGSLSRPGSQ